MGILVGTGKQIMKISYFSIKINSNFIIIILAKNRRNDDTTLYLISKKHYYFIKSKFKKRSFKIINIRSEN